MLKVVAITDKQGSAIWRLAKGLEKYLTNIDYKVVAFHPKRPDAQQIADFEREAIDADILDFEYFRTAQKIMQMFPWVKEKKKILFHHNPYSIEEDTWNDFDIVCGNSKYIYERLGKITERPVEYIGNTVDTDFWQFNPDWQPVNSVIMVAARIEGKKGILPVAQACSKLNIKMHLVGSISDMNYFQEIIATGNVVFHQNITDEELRDLYYQSGVYVFNSIDNFESSGQPLLEAMLTGVPVLARRVGIVPELYNGDNMVIHEGQSEDVDGLVNCIQQMIGDKKRLFELRNNAWQTAKARSNERRAYEFQKLYRQTLHPDQAPVSIMVPIYDRPEIIRKNFDAIAKQTYKNIELIVADDNPTNNQALVEEYAKYVSFPVRYLHTARPEDDYGLQRGRNLATIEATGSIMVYCDQRQVMEPDCVEEFVKNMKPRYWLFGNKGSNKKAFVENLSAVYRKDVVIAGMFSERCNNYGAASEELRKRIRYQGIKTEYVESAKAIPSGKSGNRSRKRDEIIRSKNMIFKLYGDIAE